MGCRRRRAAQREQVSEPIGGSQRWLLPSKRRAPLFQAGAGVFFCTLLLAACARATAPFPTADGIDLQIGFPEGIVAGNDVGAAQFAALLSLEGLTYVGVDGRPVPRLAESWIWEDGGRRLRVILRSDVTLHDGQPLNAPLVTGILQKAVADVRQVARYPSLSSVTRVSPRGMNEIVIELSVPTAALLEDLSLPIQVQGAGTGPYRVVTRTTATTELQRFDRYYLGRPVIRHLTVNNVDTLRTAWTSLLRGKVDMVADLQPDAVEFIRNDAVQVVSFERWYQFLIAFNAKRGPLRSPQVRRALNLALDRNELITRVFQGRATPSSGPIWPKYWAYDTGVSSYSYDPAQAAALLDAAGYKLPAAAPRGIAPARLRFTCVIPSDFSVWERIALEVQKSLFSVGVDMQFKVVPFEDFNRIVLSGEFDAIMNDMISGPTPERAYMFWASAKALKGYNTFGYENPEAERLFQTLRGSSNEAAVRYSTRRLQRVLLDDPPALFIAWNQRARAMRRNVTIPDEPGRDPLLTLWRWKAAGPTQVAASVQ